MDGSCSFGDTHISLRDGLVIGGLVALGVGLARLRTPVRVHPNEGMLLLAPAHAQNGKSDPASSNAISPTNPEPSQLRGNHP